MAPYRCVEILSKIAGSGTNKYFEIAQFLIVGGQWLSRSKCQWGDSRWYGFDLGNQRKEALCWIRGFLLHFVAPTLEPEILASYASRFRLITLYTSGPMLTIRIIHYRYVIPYRRTMNLLAGDTSWSRFWTRPTSLRFLHSSPPRPHYSTSAVLSFSWRMMFDQVLSGPKMCGRGVWVTVGHLQVTGENRVLLGTSEAKTRSWRFCSHIVSPHSWWL